MKILTNTTEMERLHAQHNNAVKNIYQCDFESFGDWLSQHGHENPETNEYYVEIPSNETLSGNAVILDWEVTDEPNQAAGFCKAVDNYFK